VIDFDDGNADRGNSISGATRGRFPSANIGASKAAARD
jgi:hypothetical protein